MDGSGAARSSGAGAPASHGPRRNLCAPLAHAAQSHRLVRCRRGRHRGRRHPGAWPRLSRWHAASGYQILSPGQGRNLAEKTRGFGATGASRVCHGDCDDRDHLPAGSSGRSARSRLLSCFLLPPVDKVYLILTFNACNNRHLFSL